MGGSRDNRNEPASGRGAPTSLQARIDAFLEWSLFAKGALISFVVLSFFVCYGVAATFVRTSQSLHGLVDPAVLRIFEWTAWIGAAGWAALAIWGLSQRRMRTSERAYAHVLVQYYAVSNMVLAYCVGPFSGVTWIVIFGAFAGGLLVFDGRIMFPGMVTALFVLTVGIAAAWAEWLPFQPLLGSAHDESGQLVPLYLLPQVVSLGVLGSAFLGVLLYISRRLREQKQRLVELSTLDSLTALYNRRHLLELLEGEYERAKRYETALAVIMLDLDNFKKVNDTEGHLAGDDLLRRVADTIGGSLRAYDRLGRYGGDEFIVLAPGANLEAAVQIAERCITEVQRVRVSSSDDSLVASASAGVAAFPDSGIAALDDLIQSADEALYRAKARGRNRVYPSYLSDTTSFT